MRLAIILVLLVFAATPAQAEPSPAFRALLATNVALHGADLSLTMHCLGAGTCRELNPVMRSLADHPAWFGATKMGIAALSTWAKVKIYKRNRKLAWWITGAEAAGTTIVILHNRSALRGRS